MHLPRHPSSIAAVLALAFSAAQADPLVALEELRAQLAAERAKTEGRKSEAKCPSDMKAFVGLTRMETHVRLGGPDLFTLGKVSPPKITSATYFISPKALPGKRGGGAPEVTFVFDDEEKVKDAACTLSR